MRQHSKHPCSQLSENTSLHIELGLVETEQAKDSCLPLECSFARIRRRKCVSPFQNGNYALRESNQAMTPYKRCSPTVKSPGHPWWRRGANGIGAPGARRGGGWQLLFLGARGGFSVAHSEEIWFVKTTRLKCAIPVLDFREPAPHKCLEPKPVQPLTSKHFWPRGILLTIAKDGFARETNLKPRQE